MKQVFILCLGLLLTACTYSPDEEFFKEISLPQDPIVSITLNEIPVGETFHVFEPTTFYFDCRIDNGRIEELEVLLDGNVIKSQSTGSGSFFLNYGQLITGAHELKIRFISTTGSGSLAEKIGAEKYEIWGNWQMVVDMTYPAPPVPVVSNENGVLKISWQPYTKPNFVAYKVYINDAFLPERIFTITDPEETSVLVNSYVGGFNLNYSVHLQTRPHTTSGWGVIADEFNLQGEFDGSDSTVHLTWDMADYSGVFKSYTLLEDNEDKFEITDVNQHSMRFKPSKVVFGLPLSFQVRTNAHSGYSPVTNGFVVQQPIETPRLEVLPDYFMFHETLNRTVGVRQAHGIIILYDDHLSVQESKNIVSPNVNWLLPTSGPYAYYGVNDLGIARLNIQTNEVEYIDIVRYTSGGILASPRPSSGSGNQIVVLNYSAHNSVGMYMVQHVMVYDIINKKSLYHAESLNNSQPVATPVVSSDGQHLYIPGKGMHRINGTVIELLYQLPGGHNFLRFRPDKQDEVMSIQDQHVHIYQTGTGVLLRSIPSPGANFRFRGYDPVSSHLLWVASGETEAIAIDIDSKAERKIHAYARDAFDFQLFNGFLITDEGFYFKAIPE